MTGGAAAVVLCVVAGSAVTVGSTRTYALAEGHGMDGTAALLVAMSLGGLIIGASLALLGEERGPWVPGTAEGMQLLGLAVMGAADIVSGAPVRAAQRDHLGLAGGGVLRHGGHGAGTVAPLPHAPPGQASNGPGGAR
jgi:hypothetical protein